MRTLFALQSMVGSDIAELLMQDCGKLQKYKRQPPVADLITLTDDDRPVLSSGSPNLLTGESPPSMETPAQIMEKFTKLLYYGRKKASARPQACIKKATGTPPHSALPQLCRQCVLVLLHFRSSERYKA